jgi:phosphoribosyl-dephospho-CoA transferase
MDAIVRTAREAGTYQVTVEALTGLVDADLTDAEFRALARRELAASRRRIDELRGEAAR